MGALRRVEAGGALVDARLQSGHIVLPASALRTGSNRVTIEFDAGDASLNRNDDFLYTIFVPARAHEAFPCFDQPDLKARWTLALDVPEGWETLANGAETTRVSARRPDARDVRRNAADPDLPVRVCGRKVLRRSRGAQRPHVPHGAPGDRRAKGRTQSRRVVRSPRRRARVARTVHGHSLSLRQVRFPARAGVSVRRHGAPGRRLLQRLGPDAR